MIGPIRYGEAPKPPTTCGCPEFGGTKMHFDDCAVMKAAVFAHRKRIEEWIAHHVAFAGIAHNGLVNIEDFKMRCKLLYGKDNTVTLEIDGKPVSTVSNLVAV